MKNKKNKTKKLREVEPLHKRGHKYIQKMKEVALSLDISTRPVIVFKKPKSFYAKMALFFMKKSKAIIDIQLTNINPKQ